MVLNLEYTGPGGPIQGIPTGNTKNHEYQMGNSQEPGAYPVNPSASNPQSGNVTPGIVLQFQEPRAAQQSNVYRQTIPIPYSGYYPIAPAIGPSQAPQQLPQQVPIIQARSSALHIVDPNTNKDPPPYPGNSRGRGMCFPIQTTPVIGPSHLPQQLPQQQQTLQVPVIRAESSALHIVDTNTEKDPPPYQGRGRGLCFPMGTTYAVPMIPAVYYPSPQPPQKLPQKPQQVPIVRPRFCTMRTVDPNTDRDILTDEEVVTPPSSVVTSATTQPPEILTTVVVPAPAVVAEGEATFTVPASVTANLLESVIGIPSENPVIAVEKESVIINEDKPGTHYTPSVIVMTPITTTDDGENRAPAISTSLKYTYKDDQWSPLNPEGKKTYDRYFLLQLQNNAASQKTPEGLPIILQRVRDKGGILDGDIRGYNFVRMMPAKVPITDM